MDHELVFSLPVSVSVFTVLSLYSNHMAWLKIATFRIESAAGCNEARHHIEGAKAIVEYPTPWDMNTLERACCSAESRSVFSDRPSPAIFASSAKSLLIRFAIVSQFSSVMSELLTLTICSTFTFATCLISGTELMSSSPRSEPAL